MAAVDPVLVSLRLGAARNLERGRELAGRGLLGPAAYHLYVALQLRAASVLRLADPSASHTCSASLILRLAARRLRERGLVDLAEEVEGFYEEWRDVVIWAEKLHSLILYKPMEVPREKLGRLIEAIEELGRLEERVEERLAGG